MTAVSSCRMPARVDSRLIVLFGSETRVRVLAALAHAARPLTAYRIAKASSVAIPNAYREVVRLHRGRLVVRKGKGWVLADRDVRDLLRKRVALAGIVRADQSTSAPRIRLPRLRHKPCGFEWTPRVLTPKQCRHCHRRLRFPSDLKRGDLIQTESP